MKSYLLLLLCIAYGVHSSTLEGQDPESEYLLSTHIIHVTNPEEFLRGAGQVKIGLRLHGPFVYNVKVTKNNVKANPNGTATFDGKKTYTFNPQESIAKEEDAIFTVPNVPYFNLINSNEDPKVVEELTSQTNSGPFVQKTVKELLWGYEDPLLKLMSEKNLRKGSTFGIFSDDEETQGVTLVVSSKSKSGVTQNYDKIQAYNGLSRFTTWGSEMCDEIKGTDLMDPDVRIQPTKTGTGYESFFHLGSRICRPLKFSYDSNETDPEGHLKFLRYKPDNEFFGGVEKYPENKCFCSTENNCPKIGTADISKCRPGFVLSRPYFKLADESIRKNYESSFQPHDDDENMLELDASSGKITNLKLSLQWNVRMKKVEAYYNQTLNFTDVLLPLIQSSDIIQTETLDDEEEYQGLGSPEAMELASPDGAKKVVKKIIEKKIEKKLLGKKKKGKSSASTLNNHWAIIITIMTTITMVQLLF